MFNKFSFFFEKLEKSVTLKVLQCAYNYIAVMSASVHTFESFYNIINKLYKTNKNTEKPNLSEIFQLLEGSFVA